MISVPLKKQEIRIICGCLTETYGYAGEFLENFLNNTNIEFLENIFRQLDTDSLVKLEKEQWLDVYNLINATMYELGTEELNTLLDCEMKDLANTARRIFTTIYDRYQKWDDFK